MDKSYPHPLSHRQSAQRHFIKRCRERYGIDVSAEDYQQIMSAIRYNQKNRKVTAFFTRDLDNVTKLYQLNIKDVSMYVIYDLNLDELTTALSANPKEIRNYAIGTSIF